MDSEELHRLAVRQLADYDARTPNRLFAQPMELSAAQAYRIQEAVARLRGQRGETLIGYKVGCTSLAVQEQLGMREPIFGRLFDTGCHPSGSQLSFARYAQLAVEGELAVRLALDLSGPPLPEEACEEAIAEVFPVIELHQFVLRSARPSAPELIASNCLHAGVVLPEQAERCGRWHGAAALTIRITDASGGVVAESATLSPPAESLRWLAGQLAESGERLSRGQVVLTGSPLRLFPVTPCSRIVVEAASLGRACAAVIP